MKIGRFHFDSELKVLLPRDKRASDFDYPFRGPQSVKHLIESLGIPHTEIGEMRANSHPIELDYLVYDGDRIEVQAATMDEEKDEPRFVLDGHLGRLTNRLRMLGLDCLYRSDYEDRELAEISANESRILLTRDRRLLMRKSVTCGYLLRSLNPREQFQEVVRRYSLIKWIRPFRRCIRCNHLLESVGKEKIIDRLEPLTKLYFQEFHICPACGQIYWKGSHYEKMQRLIESIK